MFKNNLISNLNQNLTHLENDFFYHLYLGKTSHDLKEMFGDVKFVCMGGQSKRMHKFANYMKKILSYQIPSGLILGDITEKTDRYSMFKIGPVLCLNHGIGGPSLSIVLNEVLKLLLYAEAKDFIFFRLGTSGGIGIEPGTVVITEEALDGLFRPQYQQFVLGKEKNLSTSCDQTLNKKLLELSNNSDKKYKVQLGKTLCSNGFYEEQARIDGIFCEYTNDEKLEFLQRCKDTGIANIEMESLCFAGILNHAKIKFAIVCVTLLDRLKGDQITETTEKLLEFQERPFELIGQYIKECCDKMNL